MNNNFITPPGEVALFNAEQSSTESYLNLARFAIDGDRNTGGATTYTTGTHWLQVSMSNTPVYQIVLAANSRNSAGGEIKVLLYSGGTLAGQCGSYTRGTRTLSCDRVTADRVRVTMSSTSSQQLYVYEITVARVPTMTIGLYLVSARIISSEIVVHTHARARLAPQISKISSAGRVGT